LPQAQSRPNANIGQVEKSDWIHFVTPRHRRDTEIHYVWAVALGLKKRTVKLEVSDIRPHRQQHNSSYGFIFNTEERNDFPIFEQ
jgi:hypothetical protein